MHNDGKNFLENDSEWGFRDLTALCKLPTLWMII